MIRAVDATQCIEVPPDRLALEIARQFHIAPAIVAKALNVLRRQGDLRGPAASA